ncbi:MAG: PilZ domain-containing protein [Treponema sp.]|nr:PilZ domain-containing protein [Treponema sp.]
MSETANNADLVGKKIFFLHPTVVVQNRIITELVQQEYEVYVAKNKDSIKKVLRKYPDSILFIDINEHMPEKEWDLWITAVMEASDTKSASIGIITANEDEQIKRKYLLVTKVPCGYTILRFDLEKAITHIMAVLHNVNAKGRRKYIRATTEHETNTTMNMPWHGNFINGHIKDISVVGISCTLDSNPDIPKNTLCKDIQIKLQSSLLKVEGIVLGSRKSGLDTVYVILFTQRIDPEVRIKIRKYIQHNLQSKMEFDLR